MANGKPTAADLPENFLDTMARALIKAIPAMEAFYADPANEAAFWEWKRKKEARNEEVQ